MFTLFGTMLLQLFNLLDNIVVLGLSLLDIAILLVIWSMIINFALMATKRVTGIELSSAWRHRND